MAGRGMINFEGPARIQVAKWIITQTGQVNYGIESYQVSWNNIANVFSHGRDVPSWAFSAFLEVVGV
jgi:hypothetical protein